MSGIKRYLFYFVQDLWEFRLAEFESIMRTFNISAELPKENLIKPFWILKMHENEARKIASRSVLLRSVFELWSSGVSFNDFHNNLKKFQVEEKYKTESFKFRVESFNKSLKQHEKIKKIDSMSYLNFEGPIDLNNPTNTFVYFEYYGLDRLKINDEPEEIFMGKFISEGSRELISSISLKTRKFIGNTSMSPELSILMATQGLCNKNCLVFDPFCGTGSTLISAALLGATVIGSDIDFLMLHGRTRPSRINQKQREKDEGVKANMVQYNLAHLFLDVFVGDFATCPLRDNLKFDAIICDPPYGMREAMTKLERKDTKVPPADAIHYPSLSSYSMKHLFDDLLKYSVKHLTINGRLVCWFPCIKDVYNEKMIPQHTALRLVANCEQKLQGFTSRRLLTYEKISEEGELIQNELLEGLNYRETYFDLMNEKRARRKQERAEHNQTEASKRGIILPNLNEYKQNANQKRFKE